MVHDKRHENALVRPDKQAGWAGALYDFAEVMALAMAFILVLFTFFGRHAAVDGISMLPTLEDGQRLAITASVWQPKRGDIVVLSPANGHREPLVKRIIAIAGDEINLVDGRVLVNGAVIDEPYLSQGTVTHEAHGGAMAYPVRVPPNHVFVMGDNRSWSSDSRSNKVGFVQVDDILGKALFRFWPFFQTKPFHFTFRVK